MNFKIIITGHQTFYRWPPSKEEFNELYWRTGFSTHKIAKIFGKTHEGVRYRMDKYSITRRGMVEATILANTRHTKSPFNGSLTTKAYLLGLRAGDLAARWSRRCVEVSTSTTHRAMVELFRNIFSKYGKVNISPRYKIRDDSYFWALNVRLDRSFRFLIDKSTRMPPWVASNQTFFLHFLAGYFDAEGTIYCYKHGSRADICLQIASTDLGLLKGIKDVAGALGYGFRLTLTYPQGSRKGYGSLNKDYWYLRLYRDNEVISLLKKLPLIHKEKLSKRKLALFVHGKEWHRVEYFIRNFRVKIKEETVNHVLLAEKEFNQGHMRCIKHSC